MQKLSNFFSFFKPKPTSSLQELLEQGYRVGSHVTSQGARRTLHFFKKLEDGTTSVYDLPSDQKNPLGKITLQTILEANGVESFLMLYNVMDFLQKVVEENKEIAFYCKEHLLGENKESITRNLLKYYQKRGVSDKELSSLSCGDELLFDQNIIQHAREKAAAISIVNNLSEICNVLADKENLNAWDYLLGEENKGLYEKIHPEGKEGYWSTDEKLIKTILDKAKKLFDITDKTCSVADKDQESLEALKTFIMEKLDASEEEVYYPIPQPYWRGSEALIDCLALAEKLALFRRNSLLAALEVLDPDHKYRKQVFQKSIILPTGGVKCAGYASERLPVTQANPLRPWHLEQHRLGANGTYLRKSKHVDTYNDYPSFGWTDGLKVYIQQWGVIPSHEFLHNFKLYMNELQLRREPTEKFIEELCEQYDLKNPLNKQAKPPGLP